MATAFPFLVTKVAKKRLEETQIGGDRSCLVKNFRNRLLFPLLGLVIQVEMLGKKNGHFFKNEKIKRLQNHFFIFSKWKMKNCQKPQKMTKVYLRVWSFPESGTVGGFWGFLVGFSIFWGFWRQKSALLGQKWPKIGHFSPKTPDLFRVLGDCLFFKEKSRFFQARARGFLGFCSRIFAKFSQIFQNFWKSPTEVRPHARKNLWFFTIFEKISKMGNFSRIFKFYFKFKIK